MGDNELLYRFTKINSSLRCVDMRNPQTSRSLLSNVPFQTETQTEYELRIKLYDNELYDSFNQRF